MKSFATEDRLWVENLLSGIRGMDQQWVAVGASALAEEADDIADGMRGLQADIRHSPSLAMWAGIAVREWDQVRVILRGLAALEAIAAGPLARNNVGLPKSERPRGESTLVKMARERRHPLVIEAGTTRFSIQCDECIRTRTQQSRAYEPWGGIYRTRVEGSMPLDVDSGWFICQRGHRQLIVRAGTPAAVGRHPRHDGFET
jgi:hypothetical protein